MIFINVHAARVGGYAYQSAERWGGAERADGHSIAGRSYASHPAKTHASVRTAMYRIGR
jgi:hypothetical protein